MQFPLFCIISHYAPLVGVPRQPPTLRRLRYCCCCCAACMFCRREPGGGAARQGCKRGKCEGARRQQKLIRWISFGFCVFNHTPISFIKSSHQHFISPSIFLSHSLSHSAFFAIPLAQLLLRCCCCCCCCCSTDGILTLLLLFSAVVIFLPPVSLSLSLSFPFSHIFVYCFSVSVQKFSLCANFSLIVTSNLRPPACLPRPPPSPPHPLPFPCLHLL